MAVGKIPPEPEGDPAEGRGLELVAPHLTDAGPWGPGGFEITLTADEEAGVIAFLRSIKANLTKSTAEHIARYACALSHFAHACGPPDTAAVGKALNMPGGAVHNLLNANRRPWSAHAVRHKLGVAALRQPIDGILLSHFFTDYQRPGHTIITAHAFAESYRLLVSAKRARFTPDDQEDARELAAAYRRLILEVAYLLSSLDPSEPVPVLAESPFVGQAAIASLVASNLNYLVELAPSWSAGGLVAVDDILKDDRMMKPGATLRNLFPVGSLASPDSVSSCAVTLNAWSPTVNHWAISIGQAPNERCYLGRMSTGTEGLLASRAGPQLEAQVARWSSEHLAAGAGHNYGLEHYHAPSDEGFLRHCTMLTLRDAYLLDQAT